MRSIPERPPFFLSCSRCLSALLLLPGLACWHPQQSSGELGLRGGDYQPGCCPGTAPCSLKIRPHHESSASALVSPGITDASMPATGLGERARARKGLSPWRQEGGRSEWQAGDARCYTLTLPRSVHRGSSAVLNSSSTRAAKGSSQRGWSTCVPCFCLLKLEEGRDVLVCP
ncbi:hypothetical protein GN956_G25338 [Arapaima gigas]